MSEVNEYDDPAKGVAWAGYWQGYKLGYGVENTDSMDRRVAKMKFERWWSINVE